MDIISEKKIKKYLKYDLSIRIEESVDSTNTVLKKTALNSKKLEDGCVLIAKKQTAGRGRHGRSFYSPENTGIYMSLLLRPDFGASKAAYITPAAAVAVCHALEASGSEATQIKWVNDIFCGCKKVCGILTEISFKPGSTDIDFLIVGIGINLTTEIFPLELEELAAPAFTHDNFSKNKIIASVLNNLYDFYKNIEKREFLNEYRERSLLTDKDVILISGEKQCKAHVIGIDDEFNLFVSLENGSTEHISTGEVSVRFSSSQ